MEKPTYESLDKQHILLTSLGTNAFLTKYEWGEETATAELAPLALVEFLNKFGLPMPNHVVAVVTEGAKAGTWLTFEEGIEKICDFNPVKVEMVEIPNGIDSSEIGQILESVANIIPEGADLTLDVTHGLRHFPFIFYALVLYLKSLRRVEIRGAYYGMVDAGPSKPIIDLQPLLELPEWFHAVRMFRDQGTTSPIAHRLEPLKEILKKKVKVLDDKARELFKDGKQGKGKKLRTQAEPVKTQAELVETSIDSLNDYAFAYESALPLELGKASKNLINSIEKLPSVGGVELPPLVTELTGVIVDEAKKSKIEDPTKKGWEGEWKRKFSLDVDELERQACMIDKYLERNQLLLAVGLIREWVVSWTIWKSGKSENIKKWLDSRRNIGVRSRYERILGAIGASAKSGGPRLTLTPEQVKFRKFWNRLTDNLRNALYHSGMRTTETKNPPSVLENVKRDWNLLKEDVLEKTSSIDLPPLGGRLLISPQGRRPGVLFSALKVADPDVCLVICSDISADSTREAADKAGFKGHIEQIKLDDPLGGFDEIEKVAEYTKGYLSYADEVRANITGGSTLMGVIVQQLVEEAQKLGRPAKRFALIDRRSTEEQERNPFVPGKPHWLD